MDLIFNDIHSHVIPCIDDGSKSLEASLEMIQKMALYGTKKLILTPHYSQRRKFTPEKEKILTAANSFREHCEKLNTGIEFYTGCEIEYSSDIPRLLSENKLVTLANSNYVLVEFAPYVHLRDITAALHAIIQTGHIPVIAHIERYPYIKGNLSDVESFKKIGALVQVNLNFVAKRALFTDKFLKELIKNRFIDFVGSDIHWEAFSKETAFRGFNTVKKHSDENYANDIFFKNAEKILFNDKEIF